MKFELPHPLRALIARGRRRPVAVFYDEAYRLPFTGADGGGPSGALELRRADEALSYLLHAHAIGEADVHGPTPVTYEALERVHHEAYLDALQTPQALAHIFAVDPSDIVPDSLINSIRLACGATLEAARLSLERRVPALNLLGGFHHAAPDRGAGFCALNDVAVAIRALRVDGFLERVAVIDLDFHPPDGTAACLGMDASVWLGSISGATWGDLPGVDETVLAKGAGDAQYLEALHALLSRMPPVGLAFVLAGGDVLVGDRLGGLGLSLAGIRARDLAVAERLGSMPQVWLPAGGYSAHAWKVLAGTGLVLSMHSEDSIPTDYDPVASNFTRIAKSLQTEDLGNSLSFTEADLADVLHLPKEGPPKLLGFYTAQGAELALERYRLLPLVRRMGFGDLRLEIERVGTLDRVKLVGVDLSNDARVVLIELEVERRAIGGGTFLFVNWLSLRNPRAKFSSQRPQLPGQEVPGLGLSREMTQILAQMSQRLTLDGVAFRPSWFHMAYAARHSARFVNPQRQGRFQALLRDLREVPLLEATRAVADGRVLLNGAPYTWEADEMVVWRVPRIDGEDEAQVAAERERCSFSLATDHASSSSGRASQ